MKFVMATGCGWVKGEGAGAGADSPPSRNR